MWLLAKAALADLGTCRSPSLAPELPGAAPCLSGLDTSRIQTLRFDVLIGNLPNRVTESLLKLLPGLSFRTAVLAVGEATDLNQLGPAFTWSEVTTITGNDFLPPQPSVSRIVKVIRKSTGRC